MLPLNKNIIDKKANTPIIVVTIPTFLERIQPEIASKTLKSTIPKIKIMNRYLCLLFARPLRDSIDALPKSAQPKVHKKNIVAVNAEIDTTTEVNFLLSFLDNIAPRNVNANPPNKADTSVSCSIIFFILLLNLVLSVY